MGDTLLTAARWTLGVGLGSALATVILLAASTLRGGETATPSHFAFAWTFTWLSLGMLLRMWASQQVWGQPWHWAGSETWSLIALLALLGGRQVRHRRRLAWLVLCLLAGILGLIGLPAS